MKSVHSKMNIEGMPDLVKLLKYEMSGCSQDELVSMCQELVNTGLLPFFDHPLRRTAYDLALGGLVSGILLPKDYSSLTLDPERLTELNITMN